MAIIIKNQKEIDGIRKSCKLLANLFEFLIPKVRPGMTTREIDELCYNFILSHGGKPAWHREDFPGSACISVNEQVIHGIPSSKKILDGDIVSIDIGIDLDGYISDSTHTILVGNVAEPVRKLVLATRECLNAAILACVHGARIRDISNAVYQIANKKYGYGVVEEYCGHGVGLDVHEDPSIPNYPYHGANPRIKAGMVLAIEPMVNLGKKDVFVEKDGWTVVCKDRKPSAHEEHTVAIFQDHTEILTECKNLPDWA